MHHSLAVVVVVGWNSRPDLPDCLAALSNQDYANYKIVFVDNASNDDSLSFVTKQFPDIDIVSNTTNRYFAGGHNDGINYAIRKYQPEFVAIINPDTTCNSQWLRTQIDHLHANPNVGIVGAKTLFANGFGADSTHLSSPTQAYINTVGLHPGGFLFPYDMGFGELDTGQYNTVASRFAVSGVSMVMRAEMLKQVGVFWEPLQLYLEDAELCIRATKAGWQIAYVPTAIVQHKLMRSTKQHKSGFYTHYSRRNYLAITLKHYGLKKFLRAAFEVTKELGILRTLPLIGRALIITTQPYTLVTS